MKVMVTGAGGFVGRAVVSALLATNKTVVATGRHLAGLKRSYPDAALTAVEGDLEDRQTITSLLGDSGVDAMVHLAWYAGPTDYLTSSENLRSMAVTIELVQKVLAAGCRKLVLAGSCVEYAPQARSLREDDPCDPNTLYGACKYAAYLVTTALANAAGAELSWGRIFHVNGPGEDQRRLVPWVASQLREGRPVDLTDGTQTRDHLHVGDVASGLATLLTPGAQGVYNICSGTPVTLREILETVGDLVGGKELLRFGIRPHRAGENPFLVGDSSRLRILGWTPRYGLRDGLENALGASI